MASWMFTLIIIFLATSVPLDFVRVRRDTAGSLLDATVSRTSESVGVGADDGSEAVSPVRTITSLESPRHEESDLLRAVAALDAATDDEDDCRALGDSAIEASMAKLDTIKLKLADLLSDSLAKRRWLYDAAGRGEVDVVTDLVKEGVNVKRTITEWHFGSSWTGTPLQHAAKQGHPEAVRVLLEAGADKDCTDKDSKTPLWYAAEGTVGDSLGVMRVLLEAGANTTSACASGMTPLHIAAAKGHEAAVHMLLDFGADVDGSRAVSDPESGGKGRGSPLVDATGSGSNYQVARILLEAGADPNITSSRGRSVLHNCAEWGYADIAHLLLKADANKDAIDEDGKTPLFVAAQKGCTEVAQILIEAGARTCLGNNHGATPATVAKNAEIRKMLEMVPKVVVTIHPSRSDSDQVVVTSAGGKEVMKLPGYTTLAWLRSKVAHMLKTDPPMVEVQVLGNDVARNDDVPPVVNRTSWGSQDIHPL